MKIALVIGHTKNSPGACNNNYQTCEFPFNEKLVKDLADRVANKHDIEIVYRDTYSGLPDKINALYPKFIVSFHCNAFNKRATGTETLYYHSSTKGKAIAEIFQKNLVSTLGLSDRGIKPKSAEDRGGYVLRYTKAPCVLLEPFFIDNDSDYLNVMMKYENFLWALEKSLDESSNLF
jgi:N-acetylmuramoyl-L-alanine amidase